MPKIPRNLSPGDLPGPKVRTIADQTPFQNIRVPQGAFGGQIGGAVAGLGQATGELAEFFQKQQDDEDKRQAQLADVEFSKRKRAILFGDGTEANPGYYGLNGQAAVDARPAVDAALQEAAVNIMDAHNTRVSGLLKTAFAVRMEREFGTLDPYTARQGAVAKKNASDASLQEGLDDFILYHNDPSRLALLKNVSHDAIRASNRGQKKEFIQGELEAWDTTAHTGVIGRLLASGDVEGAEAWFKTNKGEINAVAHEAILIDIARTKTRLKNVITQAELDIENDFLNAHVQGKLTAQDVVASQLKPATKRIYLNMLKADPDKITTNSAVYLEALRRIYLPENDPDRITDAGVLNGLAVRGQITITDRNTLAKEVEGLGTPEGRELSDIEDQFNKDTVRAISESNSFLGRRDPEGDAAARKAMVMLSKERQRLREAGVPKHLWYDPNPKNEHYLGRIVKPFITTASERFAKITAELDALDKEEPGFFESLFGSEEKATPVPTKKSAAAPPKKRGRGRPKGSGKAKKAPKGFDPAKISDENIGHDPKTGQTIYLFKGEWYFADGSLWKVS